MTTHGNPETKSTEQIRAELEGTRGDVSQDIAALTEKLKPSNLAHEAKEGVKEAARQATNGVREAAREATGGMKDAAHQAKGRVQDGAHMALERAKEVEERAVTFARNNPIPVALIGLGAGWLLVDGLLGSNRARSNGRQAAQRLDYDYERPEYERLDYGRPDDQRPRYGGREAARDRLHQAREQMHARSDDLKHRAQDLGRTMAERTGQARGYVEEAFYDNPLAAGAVAAVLGAGLGLLAPSTTREDRMLGPARDRLFEEAHATAQQVRAAASEAAHSTAADAKNAAKDVATRAKEHSEQAAERHGLV